ncbi:MAG: sugar ABC transporter substrate-binding protein [Micrococcaceae bacterium]
MNIKKFLGILSIPALALALSGCESDASAEDTGESAAGIDSQELQSIVDDYSAPLAEEVPESSAPIAEDKLMVLIPCNYASEACARGVDSAEEAAESLGWQTRMIDPGGNPENTRQAIDQAIQLGADGIFFTAAVADQLDSNLAAAREAGIVLINSMSPADDRFDLEIVPDEDATGKMSAAAIALDSDGEAKILVITDPAFSSVQARTAAFETWMGDLCETCEIVETLETQMTQLQSGLPPQVQATLTANPQIDYIWTYTGAATVATQATVERSANGEDIKMVAFDGNAANLDFIANDRNQFLDVIKPMEHTGYVAVNEMNRLFDEGVGEHETIEMPKRLVTKETLPELPWTGDTDWQQGFQQLWGVNE